MGEACRDTVTTALMTHESVISPANVLYAATHIQNINTCVCVCARAVTYDIRAPLHASGIHPLRLFFNLNKILSAVTSIPLLPQHTHTHTHAHAQTHVHTYTLASSAIDFGIHCCHGNGIEHALSHRLFFSIALYLSLSLPVEAEQLLSFDGGGGSFFAVSIRSWMFVCLFAFERRIII